MDLTQEITALLKSEVYFAVARAYDAPHVMGTVLVLTEDTVYSNIKDRELQERLAQLARNALKNRHSETRVVERPEGSFKVFLEVFAPEDTILIVGAGHIAMPLCKMARIANFRVVLLDDRPEYANSDRFPDADRILVGPYVETLGEFPISPHTYVVLITRGHTYDRDCLEAVLGKPAAYIGMIGSRRRLMAVFKLLQQRYSRENLDRVHAPIGLPIGGNAPEAIAVSILAEIISVRYRGAEWSLSLKQDFFKCL